MALIDRLLTSEFVLGEGSMYERLRRDPAVRFDPEMAHATLVYDDASRAVLERTHREYLDIGQAYGVPILTATDTWRANRERQDRSLFRAHPVNQDNVRFLRELRASYGSGAAPILIGGSVGPRGDAYRPDEALGREAAAEFHAPQAAALAEAGPDYLIGNTLPAVSEARGIADVFAATGLPYIVSFVVRADGAVLDGTPLAIAIEAIDAATIWRPPATASTASTRRCSRPRSRRRGRPPAASPTSRPTPRRSGPTSWTAATSSTPTTPSPSASAMHEVAARFGIRALGGCCGTGTEHLEAIARLGSSGGGDQRHADEDDAGARAL